MRQVSPATQRRATRAEHGGAILAKQGIKRPHSDLFGPGGTRFLAEVDLREPPRRRLDSLLALIADFTREIDRVSEQIDQLARQDPYVDVLCQIRGIGRYLALLIIAEIGDITRFPSARQLCAWAGLTPTLRSSDGKPRLGHRRDPLPDRPGARAHDQNDGGHRMTRRTVPVVAPPAHTADARASSPMAMTSTRPARPTG